MLRYRREEAQQKAAYSGPQCRRAGGFGEWRIACTKEDSETIENTREADDALAQPDDDELNAEAAADEFSLHFGHDRTPRVLITTSEAFSTPTRKFIVDLLTVIPNAHYCTRGWYHLKQGHGKATRHQPELILNNFTTRLGHRVGRMFASISPQDPNFRGRRAVTLQYQRDFIFFRHHRYTFKQKEITEKNVKPKGGSKKKRQSEASNQRSSDCALAGVWPTITLKMQSLQRGTFDTKYGEYEWVHKPDMDTSRRRFFL